MLRCGCGRQTVSRLKIAAVKLSAHCTGEVHAVARLLSDALEGITRAGTFVFLW